MLGQHPPPLVPFVEVLELDGEKSSLQLFHAEIVTREAVLVFRNRPVVTKQADPLREIRIAGHDSTTLAAGT